MNIRSITAHLSPMSRGLAWGGQLLRSFILMLAFLGFSPMIAANTFYPLDTARQEAQFAALLKELRCLVCQNQDLADSNAGLAKDLREQVYTLVKAGKTDNEIIHYLTERYGDFILFKPPVKMLTLLLWFGPEFFLVLGMVIFWRSCLKRTSNE